MKRPGKRRAKRTLTGAREPNADVPTGGALRGRLARASGPPIARRRRAYDPGSFRGSHVRLPHSSSRVSTGSAAAVFDSPFAPSKESRPRAALLRRCPASGPNRPSRSSRAPRPSPPPGQATSSTSASGPPTSRRPRTSWRPGSGRSATALPLLHARQGPPGAAGSGGGGLSRSHRGADIDPECVIDRAGRQADDVLRDAQMFGEPGAEILYPNPGFPIYESMISFWTGAKAGPDRVDARRTASQFERRGRSSRRSPRDTSLIILNTPANPTGGVDRPRSELDALVEGPRAAGRTSPCSSRTRSTRGSSTTARPSTSQPPPVRVDPRPRDHARRLEQDLRDDRLAPGLRRLAQGARSTTPSACRSTPTPALRATGCSGRESRR